MSFTSNIDAAAEAEGLAIEPWRIISTSRFPRTQLQRARGLAVPPLHWASGFQADQVLPAGSIHEGPSLDQPPGTMVLPCVWSTTFQATSRCRVGRSRETTPSRTSAGSGRKLLDLLHARLSVARYPGCISRQWDRPATALQRACEQGRIGRLDSTHHRGRRWLITASELRELLEQKLKGTPVANTAATPSLHERPQSRDTAGLATWQRALPSTAGNPAGDSDEQAKRTRRTDNSRRRRRPRSGRVVFGTAGQMTTIACTDYFLVTGVNDIDLPIALVGTMSRREMSPKDATLSYMDALEAALVIAQKPEAAGHRMGKRDSRSTGLWLAERPGNA